MDFLSFCFVGASAVHSFTHLAIYLLFISFNDMLPTPWEKVPLG
jgi:hypothetical protein